MLRPRHLLVISSLLLVPTLAHGQRCVVDVVVLNVDRRGEGPISAECSRPHSIPFGNWGVEFPYFGSQRRMRDGYCRGESRWVEPVSGANSVYARLKLEVHLHMD